MRKKKESTKSAPAPAAKPPRAARCIKSGPARSLTKAAHPDSARTSGPLARKGLKATPLPAPAQGSIRMDLANLTPVALLDLVHNIKDGLTGNLFYPELDGQVTALTASENALVACLNAVAAADQAARTARAALETEVLNARSNLRTAGSACETEDRSDEALLSVGWSLRRIPAPPQPVPVPARVLLENTRFPGQVRARWTRVKNARFYEVKAATTGENPDPSIWNTLPAVSSTQAQMVFSDYPVGSWISTRIRAVGAKGPSPWSEAAVIRIN